jgi:general secretion pathway protein J
MKKPATGFTLLEVLVALGIVAVISILSWQGLREVLRSANRVSDVDEQVQATAAVFGQFEKDLAALETALTSANPPVSLVEVTGNGLLVQFNQRNTSEPAYTERVEWLLEEGRLLRVARREANPEQASVSPPVPLRGLQIRLLREPGGWSSPAVFGNYAAQDRNDIELQGPAAQLNAGAAPPPPSGPDGVDTGTPETPQGGGQGQQVLVRAVEISLTQPNNQTVTRVFLTGGVY